MRAMTKPKSTLDRVREHLAPIRGAELAELAKKLKISYDTLLRIRDGNTDPIYSNVEKLADHFKVVPR